MTLTIELTSEQEARLRDQADRAGLDPGDFVLQLIDRAPAKQEVRTDVAKPKTGAELRSDQAF